MTTAQKFENMLTTEENVAQMSSTKMFLVPIWKRQKQMFSVIYKFYLDNAMKVSKEKHNNIKH